ncbi:MAG TPA: hypothetical protein VNC22_13670, partial [Sporichthya sp.]|nr:hypothetical protein [Sporichthya sp.]
EAIAGADDPAAAQVAVAELLGLPADLALPILDMQLRRLTRTQEHNVREELDELRDRLNAVSSENLD